MQKLTHRQIYATAPAAPLYLCWSEWPITYDRTDHLDRVVEAGQFPLVVTTVNENTMVMKILMDGGSGINILYKDAFDKLNMDIRKLHALQSPFHDIAPRRCIMPLGTIDLFVTFGDAAHYRKETLSFEVVDFQGLYSTIFGMP